jgi:hypothetical protein
MVLSLIGVYQTLNAEQFEFDIRLKRDHYYSSSLVRAHSLPIDSNSQRYLRVFQITDPHIGKNKIKQIRIKKMKIKIKKIFLFLGTWMSVNNLQEICEKIVSLDPDLVFLTVYFFTTKGHNVPKALRDSLLPLKKINHKV